MLDFTLYTNSIHDCTSALLSFVGNETESQHGQPYDLILQVSEVLSSSKTRLSVNGWFHGPPVDRPSPYIEAAPVLSRPIPAEVGAYSLVVIIDPY